MIPEWPDRVPDSIQPLVGYRAWLFTNNVRGASLLPIGGRPLTSTAWEGANYGWVWAACPFGGRTERRVAWFVVQRIVHPKKGARAASMR